MDTNLKNKIQFFITDIELTQKLVSVKNVASENLSLYKALAPSIIKEEAVKKDLKGFFSKVHLHYLFINYFLLTPLFIVFVYFNKVNKTT